MSQVIQKFSARFCKNQIPSLKPGMIVKVHQKIKEGNKERIQVFQGVVIRTGAGHGVAETFTVRKVSEGIGVEKCFLIHSPNIVKVEVTRAQKVRRSKLNFLRDLSGKALRLKEIPLNLRHKEFESDLPAAEEVVSEETAAEDAPAVPEEKAVAEPVEEKKPEEAAEKKEEVAEAPKKEEETQEKPAEEKAEADSEKAE